MQQHSDALNLEQALRLLRRRLPLIALCVVVVAGAAFAFSKHETKKYTATASLAFSNNPLSQQIAGLSTSSSSSLVAQQGSNLELVRLGNVSAKIARLLGHGLTDEKVGASLSISAQGETGIVNVSATSTSPTLAAAIANTYASQFVKEQQRNNRVYLASALTLVKRQLAELSPAQRLGVDGLNLEDRAQTLRLLAGLKYGNVEVAQEALAPSSPSSPKTSKNTALGLLLGLLVGLGLVFLLERLDRRIRGPEELEEIYRLPMLGEVPESSALARSGRPGKGRQALMPPAEVEAFNLIRARLRFFNVDRDLRTVVIASATPGDGKTTIARHLAEAATKLGSRVLLLEADLRHPAVAQQLDIQAELGLTDVLIGAISVDEATQSVELEASSGDGIKSRKLDVLASGPTPPNPGELLESRGVDTVLEWARSAYDLVVIDTPPLAAVSDAFPLLTKVDGVIIVGRVGRSRRDAAARLRQVLAGSGALLLGVIANGSKSSDLGTYANPGKDKSPPTVASVHGSLQSDELIQTPKV